MKGEGYYRRFHVLGTGLAPFAGVFFAVQKAKEVKGKIMEQQKRKTGPRVCTRSGHVKNNFLLFIGNGETCCTYDSVRPI